VSGPISHEEVRGALGFSIPYVIQAGDVGFSHNNGVMGRIIRFGEHLKGVYGSEWNHEFVVSKFENNEWWIIQATMKGVIETPLKDVAPGKGGHYVTMAPPPECNRVKILEFAYGELGAKYSILSDVAIGIDMLTWNWVPSLMNSYTRTWNCSGLTNECLRYAGWRHEWVNIYTVTPQQGFDALTESHAS
jgi:hypothetical protein